MLLHMVTPPVREQRLHCLEGRTVPLETAETSASLCAVSMPSTCKHPQSLMSLLKSRLVEENWSPMGNFGCFFTSRSGGVSA